MNLPPAHKPLLRGSVHGRFQPLHLEHVDYIEKAFERCQFLYIGLTQPNSGALRENNAGPAHRSAEASNPLTFFERETVISRTLISRGFSRSRFAVVPFPIEMPDVLGEYLPVDVPIFTTKVEQWNDEKIRRLESLGYEVESLVTREAKGVSGDVIRQLMRDGDSAWIELVCPETADLLLEMKIPQRLAEMP